MAKMAHRPPLQRDRLHQQIEDQPQAGLIADV
jgi:hypothetical protein